MSGSASALVPNLSLAAGQGVAQAQAPNPFDMISRLADLRTKQNQNQQFQQTLAARQRAGEIISSAPDPETGIAAASKDPLVAAFAPDVINSYRTTQQVLENTQGLVGKNNQDALGGVLRAAAGAAQTPEQLDKLLTAQLSSIPESIRSRIMPAVQQFRSSLMDGLPQDGGQTFRTRLTGLMVGSGMNSDSIHSAMGTPGIVRRGDADVPTLTLPGQVNPQQGTPIQMGTAPQILDTEGPDGQKQKTLFPGASPGGNPLGVPGKPPGAFDAPWTPQGVDNAPGGQAAPTPANNALGVPTAPSAKPLPPGVISRGPTPGALAMQSEDAKADAKVIQDVNDGAVGMQKNIRDINMITDAMKQIQTGGFASLREVVGRFAEGAKNIGAPISQATIDEIANGNLSQTQILKKLAGGLAIRQLGQNTDHQGPSRLPEINQALATLGPDISAPALLEMLNGAKEEYRMRFDKSLKLPLYRAMLDAQNADPTAEVPGLPKGYRLQNFQAWYDNTYNPANIPQTTAGGVNIGPTNPADIKGTPENRAAQAAQVPMYIRGPDGKTMRNPAYK